MSTEVGEPAPAATPAPAAPATTAPKPLGMRKNGTKSSDNRSITFPGAELWNCLVPTLEADDLLRQIGKQWHAPKKAFRPGSGLTSYEKRAKERVALATVKAKEKEMKDEKEAERQVRPSRPPSPSVVQQTNKYTMHANHEPPRGLAKLTGAIFDIHRDE